LKKQQNKDEKKLQQDQLDNNSNMVNFNVTLRGIFGMGGSDNSSSNVTALNDYAVLLMPFYDKHPQVPNFFEKLLQSKDVGV